MDDRKLPLILIAISVLTFFGFGFYAGGTAGALLTIVGLLVGATINVVLGIAACFIVAGLLNTSFGEFKDACVKLAAITLFPSAAAILVSSVSPLLGILTVVILFFGLLKSMFQLEIVELIVFMLVLWGVNFLASSAVGLLVSA